MKTVPIPANFIDRWKAKHHTYERYAFRQFQSALKEQIKPVIDHIKHYGQITPSISDMLVQKAPMESVYKTVYNRVGTLHAGWTLLRINEMVRSLHKSAFDVISAKSHPIGFFSEAWNRLMSIFYNNYAAERISDVTETTRDRIRSALDDSKDMTISEQATYLEETLSSDEFTRSRAMMIARTESTTAANYGASLGNEDADYLTAKTWLAVLDANTRPDHVDASGQQVANTDFFLVGGYECMYPGDISLPASECVNCRCCVAYVPLLSESGVPILK